MIAVISDHNNDGEIVSLQIISYSEYNNTKYIMIEKSYIFKALQPGEIEFQKGTPIPKTWIFTIDQYEILKTLFTRF